LAKGYKTTKVKEEIPKAGFENNRMSTTKNQWTKAWQQKQKSKIGKWQQNKKRNNTNIHQQNTGKDNENKTKDNRNNINKNQEHKNDKKV